MYLTDKIWQYGNAIKLEVDKTWQYANMQKLEVNKTWQYSTSSNFSVNKTFLYGQISSNTNDTLVQGSSNLNVAGEDPIPSPGLSTLKRTHLSLRYAVKIKFYNEGVVYDLDDYNIRPLSFDISYRKNELNSWQMELQDNTSRTLAPYNSDSPLYNFFQPDFYERDYILHPILPTPVKLKKYMIVEFVIGDTKYYSEKLIVVDYKYNSKDRKLSLSGTDRCKDLFVENQTYNHLADYDGRSAKEIIGLILTAFGITDYVLTFDDYHLGNRIEFVNKTPIDVIKDILYVGMASWYFRNDVFYAVKDEMKTTSCDWDFRDVVNIIDLDYNQNLNDYYNEIYVGRKKISDGSCVIEGTTFGFHKESLCFPMCYPRAHVEIYGGSSVEEIYFLTNDETGYMGGGGTHESPPIVVSQYATPYPSSGPFYYISFVYKPPATYTEEDIKKGGHYKIKVYGKNPSNVNLINDNEFNYHYVDTAEQEKYGIWKYPDEYINSLIPNTTHAELLAKWIISQHKRTKINISLTSFVNPLAYPTNTIRVKDYGLACESEYFYVENIDIKYSQKEVVTTYGCVQYES